MRYWIQRAWRGVSNWHTTLEVLGVLSWTTWIIIVTVGMAAVAAALLRGSEWYVACSLGLASTVVIFLSVVIWQLWRCPIDSNVGKRQIVHKKS
jgi:uncharacterized membrane protein YjjP (DUF1212 family)